MTGVPDKVWTAVRSGTVMVPAPRPPIDDDKDPDWVHCGRYDIRFEEPRTGRPS